MSYLPPKGYARILVVAAYLLLGGVATFLIFKYLLGPFLPFLLAWITAMLLRPAIHKIAARTRLPQKAVAIFCVSFVFLLLFGLMTILCGRVIAELRSLSDALMTDAADMISGLFDSVSHLSEKLPFLKSIDNPAAADRIEQGMISMVEGAITSFSSRIPEMILDFVASLPGMILFAVALILATFYMGTDIAKINAFIARQLPSSSRHHLFTAKKKLMSAGIKYVKAYFMILSITFLQLLVGFFCLKIPFALTLAALIALIDILPILGVGTVLIPWAVILLLQGNTYTGVGLLIVFGIIWLTRQIIEPKIVGQSIGLSPLVTLIAMYVGYQFLGFGGLFVLPLFMILVKNLNDIGILRLWREEEKTKKP